MESNRTSYFAFKYGILIFGLLSIALPILMHIFPEKSTFNGEAGPPDLESTLICFIAGFAAILISRLIMDKLVIANLKNQTVKLKKGKDTIEVSWLEVESVNMIPFVFPPLYKLRIKGQENYFLFSTSRSGLNILGITFDWSDMGELIKKKKKELAI
jgi:hypothetical protein